MQGLLSNFRNTMIVSFLLSVIMIVGYLVHNGGADVIFVQAILRWTHVVLGILWIEALSLGAVGGFVSAQHTFIGVGMWLALIMFMNVWMFIWPNQKIALGMVEADDAAKAKAGRTAMLFSRTNTLLSLPMLVTMAMNQTIFG
jgi:uncharacterized membrane protein